jgi:hypothetical protein
MYQPKVGDKVEVRPGVAEVKTIYSIVKRVFKNGNCVVEHASGYKQNVPSADLRPYKTPEERQEEVKGFIEKVLERIEEMAAAPERRLEELQQDFSKDPVHAASWLTDDLFQTDALIRLYKELGVKAGLDKVRLGELSLPEYAGHLENERLLLAKREAEMPYRHSSTSVMGNYQEECKHYARSRELADGRFGGGIVGRIRRWVESVVKMEQGAWD